MPNKMLIDATHPEETRVVVLRGNRVEEFDFESANRKQLRGNIYLAKVTRVEPSLQAAFVDYGGNRHGFLAFGEIHPDYYQIPVADRQALIDEEERAARAAEVEADNRAGRRAHRERRSSRPRDEIKSAPVHAHGETQPGEDHHGEEAHAKAPLGDTAAMAAASEVMAPPADDAGDRDASDAGGRQLIDAPAGWQEAPSRGGSYEQPMGGEHGSAAAETPMELDLITSSAAAEPLPGSAEERAEERAEAAESAAADETAAGAPAEHGAGEDNITEINGAGAEEEVIESVGGADALEEVPERMSRMRRQYKIQEVIKRRQVMLVQVVKEERGTKGAALTTYLSLAGRYSVLMPNTARGGGISRKITDSVDRKRLKEVAQELEVPEGMGVILRTAGASRTKTEIKRDFEYLLRLWETVRDLTLKSTAPMLVYEEGSLVKRSIRDLYNKDIDEVLVAGPDAYRDARDFMRMLMPSHAKNVKPYADNVPMFGRFGIESQLDAMFQPVVQLRSGGYIVINQAEALVAIDVNSGRATREHHIEDTALKTNLEAAEEVARQLRLRDLAGLIVIDYIDMDEKRNNRTVERRLKEALKHDRARIQVGHISHFGLLEMSRQRIRSSVLESSTEKCPHCGGTGHVRSVSSVALQLLRAIEEMLLKGATHNLIVRTRTETALYLLNNKRAHLRELEERFQLLITVNADPTVAGQVSYLIEKGEQVHSIEQAKALVAVQPTSIAPIIEDDDEAAEDFDEEVSGNVEEIGEAGEDEHEEEGGGQPAETAQGEGERNGRKRRRRRRGRRGAEGREGEAPAPENSAAPIAARSVDESEPAAGGTDTEAETEFGGPEVPGESQADGEKRRRRRGRRGGRRSRHGRDGEALPQSSDSAPQLQAEDGMHHGEPEESGPQPRDTVPREAAQAEPEASEPDQRSFHQRDDAEPSFERHQPEAVQHRRHNGPAAEPETAPAATAPAATTPAATAPAPTAAASRRRSTVREPAPTSFSFGSEASTPATVVHAEPEPPAPASNSESEDAARPRRAGWWSKRVLGKG
ncbi:MAG TPA: Rne/Rng family ribonuclease [Xanthobacteraceae bacterium]|nr:Rne/Rng family ribonuclease [Xanthobacteraceae bacterium]